MRNSLVNKSRYFPIVITVLLLSMGMTTYGQSTDTLGVKTTSHHSPKKAALLSTAFPGLGQAYNKKYWKMPIIYAGFVGLAYSFNYNQTRYVKYRNAYKYRLEGKTDDYIGVFSDDDLFYLQKAYNRYRDLTVIGASLLYLLNIIDASVDAHLFTFDVSDDLSLNLQPTFFNVANSAQYSTGLSIRMNF